jgi:hypothetical protein
MTKQVQQSITPTHVIGSTGTADTSDLGYRALGSFKSDLGLGTSLTQTANNGNGTAGTPAFAFVGDENTGIYRPAADELGFVTNGSEKVRISSAGNVLVGQTSDDGVSRLQVSGGADISGARFFEIDHVFGTTTTDLGKPVEDGRFLRLKVAVGNSTGNYVFQEWNCFFGFTGADRYLVTKVFEQKTDTPAPNVTITISSSGVLTSTASNGSNFAGRYNFIG